MAGEALKASEQRTKANRARAKQLNALRASWVAGGENTPAELEAMERQRKAEFYERESRRAA